MEKYISKYWKATFPEGWVCVDLGLKQLCSMWRITEAQYTKVLRMHQLEAVERFVRRDASIFLEIGYNGKIALGWGGKEISEYAANRTKEDVIFAIHKLRKTKLEMLNSLFSGATADDLVEIARDHDGLEVEFERVNTKHLFGIKGTCLRIDKYQVGWYLTTGGVLIAATYGKEINDNSSATRESISDIEYIISNLEVVKPEMN